MQLFVDAHPATESIRESVVRGLSSRPRTLPPSLFYDTEGSFLFDAITALPEYYPTRTEIGIMQVHGREIARHVGEHATVFEYGSGNSTKTHLLLDVLEDPDTYAPIDVSREHLLEASKRIAVDYPYLNVLPVCADYHDEIPELASFARARRGTVFFPGSTIGNLIPEHATSFLRKARSLVGEGGGLLIGMDLQKDIDIMTRAYDDSAGVTARFNLNMLRHVNRLLGPLFDLDNYRHRAVWNQLEGRIEMHLVSQCAHEVQLDDRSFRFDEGEPLVTEYSYKYTLEQALSLLADSGFSPKAYWTDPEFMFSVHFARA